MDEEKLKLIFSHFHFDLPTTSWYKSVSLDQLMREIIVDEFERH
jgi:hypothetical protein